MTCLLAVFTCPCCGDVLEDSVTKTEIIDTERDDVFDVTLCDRCGREVQRKLDDGAPCWKQVSDEQWLAAQGAFDPPEDLP